VNLFLRVLLLLACVKFAFQALIGYAFDFRDYGYPLWPLLALGCSFAAYVALRPRPARPTEEPYSGAHVDHAFLFLVLSIVTSAFLLDKRGESPFTPAYFLDLSALTLFQLLLPFILAYSFKKGRSLATMLAMLILMVFLVDGTMKDPQPLVQYFAEARAYEQPGDLSGRLLPIAITPPDPAPTAAIQIPPASATLP